MNREIKFRGKRIDNGEWVYGYIWICPAKCWIVNVNEEGEAELNLVDPKTVGQYVGLVDKNGVEIYEGDVVTGHDFIYSMVEHWNNGCGKNGEGRPFIEPEQKKSCYEVRYHEGSFKLFDHEGKWTAVLNHHVSSKANELSVIGNIYDNPELVGGSDGN